MGRASLIELTQQYVAHHDQRNYEGIVPMLHEDFVLEDPVVHRIEGRERALVAVKELFASCKTMSFRARNIYQHGETTLIEFVLEMDGETLTGVDVIEWQGDKMRALRAYVNVPQK